MLYVIGKKNIICYIFLLHFLPYEKIACASSTSK